MAGFAFFASQEAARIKFAATADDTLNRIESRVDLHLSLLRATQALFDARNGKIRQSEFKAFFDALDVDGNFAGLRGIGFLRLVKAGNEAVAEREMRDDQGLDRSIYPASTLAWRAPIVLFEPLDDATRTAIGYDMMSDPVRRAAIHSSADRSAAGSTLHMRTRPSLWVCTSPPASSTRRCWSTAASVMVNPTASSEAERGPAVSRSSIARRVGSARAWNARSSCRSWSSMCFSKAVA